MIFRTKPKQFKIRIPSVPGVKWLVRPLSATDERELERGFEEFDAATKTSSVKDYVALIKAKAEVVILGWDDLPGEDGPIPFGREELLGLCEQHLGTISEVLTESKRADAVRAEEAEKN